MLRDKNYSEHVILRRLPVHFAVQQTVHSAVQQQQTVQQTLQSNLLHLIKYLLSCESPSRQLVSQRQPPDSVPPQRFL